MLASGPPSSLRSALSDMTSSGALPEGARAASSIESEILPPKRARADCAAWAVTRRKEVLLDRYDRIGSAERQCNVVCAAAETVLHDLSRHRPMDKKCPS